MGQNINVSQMAGNQMETTIAVDPTNPNRLFCASVADDYAGLFATYSIDGGATWLPQQPQNRMMATGTSGGEDSLPAAWSDPQAKFDSFGNLYLTYMTGGEVFHGTTTSTDATSLQDDGPGPAWAPDMWQGYQITITSPDTPVSWTRGITGNTTNEIMVDIPWDPGTIAKWDYEITNPNGPKSASIVVASSTDGGQTFDFRATLARDSDDDYPALATGPSGDPNVPGAVWVVYQRGNVGLQPGETAAPGLYAAWMDVYAQSQFGTFSTPLQIPGSQSSNGYAIAQEVAIGPTGAVMVVWDQPGVPGPENEIYLSRNSGGTTTPQGFANPLPMQAPVATSNIVMQGPGQYQQIPAQPDIGIYADPGLAWDRRTVDHQFGTLWLVYTDALAIGSNNTDVYIMYSTDNGASWSNRALVHSFSTASQFMPAIDVDQTTGYVAVVWYDTRGAVGNDGAVLYGTVLNEATVDRGPLNEVAIAGGRSYSDMANTNNRQNFGDYISVAYYGGSFYPAWADNSDFTQDNPDGIWGTMDVYMARVTTGTITY